MAVFAVVLFIIGFSALVHPNLAELNVDEKHEYPEHDKYGPNTQSDKLTEKRREFTQCGISSNDRFETWYEDLFTNSPLLFPKNDDELRSIVLHARGNGCKVRVRGSGHSEDGVVMQKLDEDVITVNLKDYSPGKQGSPDAGWNGALNISLDQPTVKISAGASLMKMISIIRPHGYLPTTSYPLPTFSVGGAYLNPSTHGATYGESRLAAQVVGVRVMNADGEILEYDSDDAELVDFRGSMGLLGIITALEIRLRKDTGLELKKDEIKTKPFNDRKMHELRLFLSDKLQNNNGTEFFYYAHEDIITSYELHFDGDQTFDYRSTSSYYQEVLSEFPDLSLSGGTQNLFAQVIERASSIATSSRSFSRFVAGISRQFNDRFFDDNAAKVRDGFFVPPEFVPRVEILLYSIRCDEDSSPTCLEEILVLFEATRSFLQVIADKEDSEWYPTTPLEWRLFTVQENEMTLEHLAPGTYLSWENIALTVEDDIVYSKYHKQLEDMWRDLFPGGGIHHGKAYGYAPVPGVGDDEGLEFPFQNEAILDSVYNEDVRTAFQAKMETYDLSGTFSAGSMLRLLGMTEKGYTPKQYDGDSCSLFGDGECLSGCCEKGYFFAKDTCIPSDKEAGDRCTLDCECRVNSDGNPCRLGLGGWLCRDT